jgi:hypothetical protein
MFYYSLWVIRVISDPDPCPVVDMSGGPGGLAFSCAGANLTSIVSGTNCTAACASGYTPSEPSVACMAGTMASITCDPDPCDVNTHLTGQ